MRELRKIPRDEKPTVAFPDEGAWKRFHADLSEWPTITCIKKRDDDKRVVSIKDGKGYMYYYIIELNLCLEIQPSSFNEEDYF